MGDILEFPSQQARGMAYLGRQLRDLLLAKGADQRLADFAAGQLTRVYAQLSEGEQYSFSVELPRGIGEQERDRLYQQINAGLEGIRRENHALMIEMAARLVLAEVRLFQHERGE
jgi:hypothetical protein